MWGSLYLLMLSLFLFWQVPAQVVEKRLREGSQDEQMDVDGDGEKNGREKSKGDVDEERVKLKWLTLDRN